MVILKPAQEVPPGIIFIPVMMLLLMFTVLTNFNLIGYNYNLDENSTFITIKEGFFNKKVYNVQINDDNGIQILQEVMLPVISAERIWQFDLIIISLFIGVFAELFQSATRQRKNYKWYVVVYVISIIVFIVWNIHAHNEILEEIGNFNKRDYINAGGMNDEHHITKYWETKNGCIQWKRS